MDLSSKQEQYVDHINSRILPFIDYDELQKSYDTDMDYAKGILNQLHEAMISVYGSERLDEQDGEDGFVFIPGVLRGSKSNDMCLALFSLDLSSSGEHWDTYFLCKDGAIEQKDLSKEIKSAYIPYDYYYTATIPCDIHVDKAQLPSAIKSVMEDFRNHRVEPPSEDEIPLFECETDILPAYPGLVSKGLSQFDILFKNGEDDFELWQVEFSHYDMHPYYGKGETTSGTIDEVLDAIKEFGSHPNTLNIFTFNDDFMNVWEVEVEPSFIEKYRNDGGSIRGTRKEIRDEITEYSEKVIEQVFNKYLGIEGEDGTPNNPAAADKSSVIEQIRNSAKASKEPPKNKHKRNKPEQEH